MARNRFAKPGAAPTPLGEVLRRSIALAAEDAAPVHEHLERLAAQGAEPREVPLDALRAAARRPARAPDPVALEGLARSVARVGVLQPLMVRPLGANEDEDYEIVFGERRWRAARLAGLARVPVLVRDLSAEDADTLAAAENLQRRSLDRVEDVAAKLRLVAGLLGTTEAGAVAHLRRMRARPHEDTPERRAVEALFVQLGGETWRSFVTNGLPVRWLPEEVAAPLREGRLPYSKALLVARAPRDRRDDLLARALGGASHAALRAARAEPARPGGTDPLAAVRAKLDAAQLARLSPDDRRRAERLLRALDRLLS